MLSHIMHAPQYHNTPTMGLYDCVAGKQATQATARCVYCPLPCPALPCPHTACCCLLLTVLAVASTSATHWSQVTPHT